MDVNTKTKFNPSDYFYCFEKDEKNNVNYNKILRMQVNQIKLDVTKLYTNVSYQCYYKNESIVIDELDTYTKEEIFKKMK